MEKEQMSFRRVLLPADTLLSSLTVFSYVSGKLSEMPLIEHNHKGKLEFIVVISGITQIIASGIPHTLYARDCFVVHENESHYFSQQLDENTEIIWFQIDSSEAESFLGLDQDHSAILLSLLKSFSGRHISLHEFILQDFVLSFELMAKDDPVSKLKGGSHFVLSLTRLLETENEQIEISPELDAAKRYIHDHIEDDITVTQLTNACGISYAELKTLFLNSTGYAPRDYIRRAKIESLRVEVAEGSKRISEIAFSYSFTSMHSFNKLFKEVTGLSPRKYRKKYSK